MCYNKIGDIMKLKTIFEYLAMTFGIVLAALSLESFLVPNLILDGGVTGVSMILSQLTPLPLSLFILVLNIPFVYIGYKNLGKRFLVKALYSMTMFSIVLSLFHHIPEFTEDILLATVFGGLFLGLGVGLVIRFGGCLDGTESVAMVLSRKTSLSVGQVVLIFNLFIYALAGFIFGFDRALYSLLTYFITFKVIDMVAEGLEQAKAAMIITDKSAQLAQNIYNKLGRTVTTMDGKGLISGEKLVMYCVITRIEIPELKRIIADEDNSAFVTITDISEIIGSHIKKNEN